jgi:hypothetical protein
VGKSTLAQALARQARWGQCVDRQPCAASRPALGNKSRALPRARGDHYLSLSLDELTSEYLSRYQRLWPRVEEIGTARATDVGARP